jgi:hypothetical protein
MRLYRQLLLILAVVVLLFESVLASQTPQPVQPASSATQNARSDPAKPTCTNNGTYVNSKGQTVQRPENCSKPPRQALLHNVGTAATASAKTDAGRALTTVVWLDGFNGFASRDTRCRVPNAKG